MPLLKGGAQRSRLAPFLLATLLGLAGCGEPAPRVFPPTVAPPERPAAIEWREIGRSVENRVIRAAEFGHGYNVTLILAGYHGDETVGAELALRLAEYLKTAQGELSNCLVVIAPEINPDGLRHGSRRNGNGVDLNRNLPAANWRNSKRASQTWGGPYPGSEPETKAVLHLLQKYRPGKVITIHQSGRGPMLDYNGPADSLARAMSRENHYPAGMFFGNLPGSLGSYAGMDKAIPIITLELRKGTTPESAWIDNRAALLAAIRF